MVSVYLCLYWHILDINICLLVFIGNNWFVRMVKRNFALPVIISAINIKR